MLVHGGRGAGQKSVLNALPSKHSLSLRVRAAPCNIDPQPVHGALDAHVPVQTADSLYAYSGCREIYNQEEPILRDAGFALAI